MSKLYRTFRAVLPGLLSIILLSGAVAGCNLPESSFELAKDSRLPTWFNLPQGVSRSDVSVTMTYYNKNTGSIAVFVLRDKKNHVIDKVTGTERGLTPLYVKGSLQSEDDGYPSYEVITARGATEVIEHKKMEPLFYVTDDPTVLKALVVNPRGENPIPTPK